MALISLRQLLDHGAENGDGVPAFNVNNMEQVHAIMQAADETDSPVILQALAAPATRQRSSPSTWRSWRSAMRLASSSRGCTDQVMPVAWSTDAFEAPLNQGQ